MEIINFQFNVGKYFSSDPISSHQNCIILKKRHIHTFLNKNLNANQQGCFFRVMISLQVLIQISIRLLSDLFLKITLSKSVNASMQ